MRKESQKRRSRERHARKGSKLTASFLEPDRELDLEEDLGAIKSSVKSRMYKGYGSDEGSSDEERQRLLEAKRDDESSRRSAGMCV